MKYLLMTITVVAFLFFVGCVDKDKVAFDEAKTQNSRASYMLYLSQFPSGKYSAEAEALADKREIIELLDVLDVYRRQALLEEKRFNWSEALRNWDLLVEKAVLSGGLVDPNVDKLKATAAERSKICRKIIEEPLTLSDKNAKITYRDRSGVSGLGLKISAVSVTGTIRNNCPYAIKSVKLRVKLYQKGYRISYSILGPAGGDTATEIERADQTITFPKPLAPNTITRFSFRKRVNAETSIFGSASELGLCDPEFSLSLIDYSA